MSTPWQLSSSPVKRRATGHGQYSLAQRSLPHKGLQKWIAQTLTWALSYSHYSCFQKSQRNPAQAAPVTPACHLRGPCRPAKLVKSWTSSPVSSTSHAQAVAGVDHFQPFNLDANPDFDILHDPTYNIRAPFADLLVRNSLAQLLRPPCKGSVATLEQPPRQHGLAEPDATPALCHIARVDAYKYGPSQDVRGLPQHVASLCHHSYKHQSIQGQGSTRRILQLTGAPYSWTCLTLSPCFETLLQALTLELLTSPSRPRTRPRRSPTPYAKVRSRRRPQVPAQVTALPRLHGCGDVWGHVVRGQSQACHNSSPH